LRSNPDSPTISSVDATYLTSGVVDTLSQTTIGIRELPPPPIPQIINITNVFQTINVRRGDPLAQSFTVDETGAFVTSIDIYNNECRKAKYRTVIFKRKCAIDAKGNENKWLVKI